MRRFLIDEPLTDGARVPLTRSDANHAKNVLRLRPGDTILLMDGRGGEYDAAIAEISEEGVIAEIHGRRADKRESPADITIAQGFLKEKKMDGLMRQLTELGIRRFVPYTAARSVARPDEKRMTTRKARWQKIAAESLKQCRRTRTTDITDLLNFENMLAESDGADLKIIFWEEASAPLTALPTPKAGAAVFAVLGPEGGLTAEEVAAATERGFTAVSLGPRILRAETAAAAAAALIQHRFGDMA